MLLTTNRSLDKLFSFPSRQQQISAFLSTCQSKRHLKRRDSNDMAVKLDWRWGRWRWHGSISRDIAKEALPQFFVNIWKEGPFPFELSWKKAPWTKDKSMRPFFWSAFAQVCAGRNWVIQKCCWLMYALESTASEDDKRNHQNHPNGWFLESQKTTNCSKMEKC